MNDEQDQPTEPIETPQQTDEGAQAEGQALGFSDPSDIIVNNG